MYRGQKYATIWFWYENQKPRKNPHQYSYLSGSMKSKVVISENQKTAREEFEKIKKGLGLPYMNNEKKTPIYLHRKCHIHVKVSYMYIMYSKPFKFRIIQSIQPFLYFMGSLFLKINFCWWALLMLHTV